MRRVSIVIPTYEEEGIASLLDTLAAHIDTLPDEFEIVVVDDSGERNRALLRAYADTHERVKVIAGKRRGKGNAVKLGVLASTGDVVFTMDADLPVSLDHIESFLRYVDEGYDVVVAERAFDRNLSDPVRFVASRVLFAVQRYVVFQSDRFLDTQCGFKAFRGDVVRDLARRQIVDGGMYDIEYLFVATSESRRIARVSVTELPSPRPSKIRTFHALVQDPKDLARVKIKALRGGY